MKETGIYNILGALDNIADKSVQKFVLLEIIPVKKWDQLTTCRWKCRFKLAIWNEDKSLVIWPLVLFLGTYFAGFFSLKCNHLSVCDIILLNK